MGVLVSEFLKHGAVWKGVKAALTPKRAILGFGP
jgi:hypothetical protein